MSEEEVAARVDAWFNNLSEEDKRKFTDRLWAAVMEDTSEQRAAAGTEGTLEGPGPDASDRPESDPPATPAEVTE